jgi:L-cystine uptake protein TcyP (sodium:dicarboxylate symporter family)
MNETLWLVVLTIVILLVIPILQLRRINVTARAEHFARIVMCLIFAAIIHYFFSEIGAIKHIFFWLAVASNALILYALTHLLDRFVLRGMAVFQKRSTL